MPPKKAIKLKPKKKPKAKKTVQKQKQAQKQTVIVQIGTDGLKPRRKRKTTKPRTAAAPAPAPAPAPPQIQQTYMAPIYIPPTPVPIIRQRIRNQADIQEQLRAYDSEQQDLVGANAAAFNATNIKKGVLFPPVLAEPARAAKLRQREAQEEEIKQRAEEAEERREAEEREFQRKKKLAEQPIDPKSRVALLDPARIGRPPGDTKDRKELIKEIKAAGTLVPGLDKKNANEVQEIAKERGIDIMR